MKQHRLLTSVIAACIVAFASSASAHSSQVINTIYGPVKGALTPGAAEFLGVRYAAPPTGSLRWMPPQPPAPWSTPMDATQFGNACPQTGVAGVPTDEDCLFLNVYIPRGCDQSGRHDAADAACDAEGADGADFSYHHRHHHHRHHHPVMVWIHGGGLEFGASNFYDPTPLVTNGNVIVVTINYRLDALGFLAHPALSAETAYHGSGNYGFMDQQFATRWVKQNIAAFGGDPDNVTIFGESAGGLSVLSNLASPVAAGLFNRAIAESGIYDGPLVFPSLGAAESLGTTFATDVGCATQTAVCLRSVPVQTLINHEADIESAFGVLLPDVDGHVLTQSPDTAFESGEFNRVPLINGTNHDEYRYFVALLFDLTTGPITSVEYASLLDLVFGSTAPAVLAEYPLANYASPDLAYATLITDLAFSCSALLTDQALSQYVRTYAYEFADENAPPVFPPVSFPQGAEHFIEVQYLFNLSAFGEPTVPFTESQQRLSDTMIRYWTDFAKSGNPNSDEKEVPLWTKFSGPPTHEVFQSLLPPSPVSEPESVFSTDHKCAFWTPGLP